MNSVSNAQNAVSQNTTPFIIKVVPVVAGIIIAVSAVALAILLLAPTLSVLASTAAVIPFTATKLGITAAIAALVLLITNTFSKSQTKLEVNKKNEKEIKFEALRQLEITRQEDVLKSMKALVSKNEETVQAALEQVHTAQREMATLACEIKKTMKEEIGKHFQDTILPAVTSAKDRQEDVLKSMKALASKNEETFQAALEQVHAAQKEMATFASEAHKKLEEEIGKHFQDTILPAVTSVKDVEVKVGQIHQTFLTQSTTIMVNLEAIHKKIVENSTIIANETVQKMVAQNLGEHVKFVENIVMRVLEEALCKAEPEEEP